MGKQSCPSAGTAQRGRHLGIGFRRYRAQAHLLLQSNKKKRKKLF